MKMTARPGMLRALSRRREDPARASESGFTLVELLITMVILPFVIGSLALAIVAVFQLNGATVSRINDAADAQVLSTSYENDVHSATEVTLQTAVQCGTANPSGTELIGLEWGANQAGGYDTVVSYVLQPTASTTSDELVRQYCTNGTATPTSSKVVAADMRPWTPSMALPPTNPVVPDPATATLTASSATNAACSGVTQGSFATGWVDASCVAGVSFAADEPASAFTYSLVAVPLASASSGKSVTLTSSSNCGFATPGSGTYASSLCFVDFTSLNPSQAASTNGSATYNPPLSCTSGGQYLTAAIDYTPFVMSFCLLISPGTYSGGTYGGLANQGLTNVCASEPSYGSVCPAWLPTYYSPPTSEAYLGNNGFYTGVSGRPALYTTQNSSTVNLNFYNIKVQDANGQSATGWELATGDAESTDHDEGIIWSTCSSLPAVSPTNPYAFQSCTGAGPAPAFSLLPDNPGGSESDDIGNACADVGNTVTGSLFPGTILTGLGTYNAGTISNSTNTVECAAGSDVIPDSTDKTGTVMLEASQPSTLSIQMHAGGLQAIFVGLVLQ